MAYGMWKVLGAAALGMALTGCGAVGAVAGKTGRDTNDVAGKVSVIRLAVPEGKVTVRGSAQVTKTTVQRVTHYQESAPGSSYASSGGTLTLRGCGRQCVVDYTVDVPAGVDVVGSGEAGRIQLSGVRLVSVTTEAGDIDVESASGQVSVRSEAGEITAKGLAGGPVSARTENGGIDLAVKSQTNVRAQTENGDVRVTVPAGAYRVAVKTDTGDRTIGVRNDPSAAHGLDLITQNGDIDVRTG